MQKYIFKSITFKILTSFILFMMSFTFFIGQAKKINVVVIGAHPDYGENIAVKFLFSVNIYHYH